MGYDVTRFQGEVDEDLLCPICSGVLEEPVQVSPCLKDFASSLTVTRFMFYLCIFFCVHYLSRLHTVNTHSAMLA